MSIKTYQVLKNEDPAFPSSLSTILEDVPLYAIGRKSLLKKPCIGICGSRDASAAALEWAYTFGKEAAAQGIVVVSGYARGIDRNAHRGAMENGGATIAVLPEGIQNFRILSDFKNLVDLDSNFLAVSSFEPTAVWKSWRAMDRNKVIVGLSLGLFVIEARDKGGTINAALECLRQKKRLWAVAYNDDKPGREGNQQLLAGSAIPLKDLEELGAALEDAMANPPPEVRQLVLNVTGDTIEHRGKAVT